MQSAMMQAGSTALARGAFSHTNYTIKRPFFSILGRKFRVFSPDGALVLFVKHPLFKLKEEWTIYTDESETTPLIKIKARSVVSFKMAYDIVDVQTNEHLGTIRLRGLKSILRDTWDLLDQSEQPIGLMTEDSMALLRRFFPFLLGKWHIELQGSEVAHIKQVFRFFTKEFTLDVAMGQGKIDTRYAIACCLLALMREIVREQGLFQTTAESIVIGKTNSFVGRIGRPLSNQGWPIFALLSLLFLVNCAPSSWQQRTSLEHSLAIASSPNTSSRSQSPSLASITIVDQHKRKLLLTNHVVVFKFFALYCQPCQRTLPEIQRISNKFPGVIVIGVSEDERISDSLRQVNQFHLSIPVIHDPQNELADRFHVERLPATLIFVPPGTLLWMKEGELSPQRVRSHIQQALHEQTTPANPKPNHPLSGFPNLAPLPIRIQAPCFENRNVRFLITYMTPSRFAFLFALSALVGTTHCGSDQETPQTEVNTNTSGQAGSQSQAGQAGTSASGSAGSTTGMAGQSGLGGSSGTAGMSGTSGASGSSAGGQAGTAGNNTAGTGTSGSGTAMCPTAGPGTELAKVGVSAIDEASGLVQSRKPAGTFWIHNDSGDSARVFGLGQDGKLQAEVRLTGINANDWEDIALGPGPVANTDYLYLADIGDNNEKRPMIQVYRIVEPSLPASPGVVNVSEIDTIQLTYPNNIPHNAETLLIDPVQGDLYIVTKNVTGNSLVFRAAAPLATTQPTTLEQVAQLTFGAAPLAGSTLVTGGDISPNGEWIALRTYTNAYLWRRSSGESIAAGLGTMPCPLVIEQEPQGEAFGFAAKGFGYYTVSESTSQPIYEYSWLSNP
jgi:thiol-disulfide isomerase/thioredoxin